MIKINKSFFSKIAVFLFFIPVLFSKLYKDDLVLSVVNYNENYSGTFRAIIEGIIGWLRNGRFFPVTTVLYTVIFRLAKPDSFFIYHMIQYVLLVSSIFLLLYIIKVVTDIKDRNILSSVALLALIVTIIDPSYHDPHVSYQWQIPLFFIVFIISVYLFNRFLLQDSRKDFFVAVLLYIICLLTYEIAYPLLMVFAFQILYRKPKKISLWGGLFLFFLMLILFQLAVRSGAVEKNYDGVVFSIELLEIIKAFTHQVFASLPLSWFWGKALIFIFHRVNILENLFYITFFLFLAVFSVWYLVYVLRKKDKNTYIAYIGLLIWLLPALPIAVSLKYQYDLSLLRAYIPRYLQSMGFVLMALPLLSTVSKKRVTTILLNTLLIVTFTVNVLNIRHENTRFHSFTLLFDLLLDNTVLEENDVEVLHIQDSFIYSAGNFLALNEDVKVMYKEEIKEGDHLLLIHRDRKKATWAYLGANEGDGIHVTSRFVYSNEPDFGSWAVTPVNEIMTYDLILESVE